MGLSSWFIVSLKLLQQCMRSINVATKFCWIRYLDQRSLSLSILVRRTRLRIALGGDVIRLQHAKIYCLEIFDNGGIVIQVADAEGVGRYLLEVLMVRRDGFEYLSDPLGSKRFAAGRDIFEFRNFGEVN